MHAGLRLRRRTRPAGSTFPGVARRPAAQAAPCRRLSRRRRLPPSGLQTTGAGSSRSRGANARPPGAVVWQFRRSGSTRRAAIPVSSGGGRGESARQARAPPSPGLLRPIAAWVGTGGTRAEPRKQVFPRSPPTRFRRHPVLPRLVAHSVRSGRLRPWPRDPPMCVPPARLFQQRSGLPPLHQGQVRLRIGQGNRQAAPAQRGGRFWRRLLLQCFIFAYLGDGRHLHGGRRRTAAPSAGPVAGSRRRRDPS